MTLEEIRFIAQSHGINADRMEMVALLIEFQTSGYVYKHFRKTI